MTTEEKNQILNLNRSGMTFRQISTALNIHHSTISNFLENNKKIETFGHCQTCGLEIEIPIKKRGGITPRFCSDQCRANYWTEHQAQIVRKSAVVSICAACGTHFSDYAKRARKYCCHDCYIAGRYKGGESRG